MAKALTLTSGGTSTPITESPVGAYPVKEHLACAERTRKDVSYPDELRAPTSDGLQARFDSGIAFEATQTAEMIEMYREADWQIIEIVCGAEPTGTVLDVAAGTKALSGRMQRQRKICVSIVIENREVFENKRAAEELTTLAMSAGAHVIFGGRIVADGRVGEPDLLLRTKPDVKRKHAFRYLGGDVKDHRSFQGKANATEWLASDRSNPFLPAAEPFEAEGIPQLKDSLQLVHYWYLLDALGRADKRVGGVIGREAIVVWRDLDAKLYDYRKFSAFEIYDRAYKSYREAVRHERARMLDASIVEASGPEWKSECTECPWRLVCHEELLELDHITLLPGITPRVARAHYEAGVATIRDLATLDHRTARLLDLGVPVDDVLNNAAVAPAETPISDLSPAKAVNALLAEGVAVAADASGLDPRTALYTGTGVRNLGKAVDQARVVKAQRVHRGRGVDFVGITRSAIELDVDIEDDGGGICYLIGVRESRRTGRGVVSKYIPFITWDHTLAGEAQNFAAFWAYVQDRIAVAKKSKVGAVRAFYYTDHETRYFRHLAEFHHGFPGVPTVEEVNAFCASDIWVDLHPVMAKQLVWPTENLTLKSLAQYARHMWRDETPGGANSVAWYISQREADEAGDIATRDELRQRILDYNEDDVVATWQLREFISRMGEARKPGLKLPGVEALDAVWGPGRPRTPQRRR